VRAAVTATVLRDLGFRDVKVYESSWLDYGNRMDAPAESVTFLNVGSLLGRVGSLEARIEALEGELNRLRGGK
jgi:thiosulfate/3-mercaptopyruvate sulfurtransferase